MVKHFITVMLSVAAGVASQADAAVVYTVQTIEPFAGGALGFSYESPDFIGNTGFIDRSALTNVIGDIQRVRFEANCPFGGGAPNCDQLTIFAGATSAIRYFADGTFERQGSSSTAFGSAAALVVTAGAVAAVPEAATWTMMIFGMAALGVSMRRQRSKITTRVGFV